MAIILIVAVLVPIIAGLAMQYNDLDKRYNRLKTDYKNLNNSYYALETDYEELDTSYQALNKSYKTLDQKYTTLNNQYTTLNNQYTSLSSQYTSLSQVFNNKLSYEVIPTTTQLRDWLTIDNTDSLYYASPNFVCGDFSVMLSQHAKLKQWDIGIVAIWGYTETYQSFAHAFNAIITTEGLVYIEPQNDNYWWYSGHQEIYSGLWWEIDNQWIYVEDYSVTVWYS